MLVFGKRRGLRFFFLKQKGSVCRGPLCKSACLIIEHLNLIANTNKTDKSNYVFLCALLFVVIKNDVFLWFAKVFKIKDVICGFSGWLFLSLHSSMIE